MTTAIEPINDLSVLSKEIIIPEEHIEPFLQSHDWTWHQIARGEFPEPYSDIHSLQLGCICSNRFLWCTAFLREPEDPDHKDPYNFYDYQVESLLHDGNTIHKDGSEVGKTREIVAYVMYEAFNTRHSSGLIGARLQSYLDEIIEALDDQLNWNPVLGKARWHRNYKDGWKKHPHHAFYFTNGFKIDFKPSGDRGQAYRGVHARTFAIKDEAVKDKHKKQWSEFWRAVKPGCDVRIYSVPDGDRSCEFYKLGQRATSKDKEAVEIDSFKDKDISRHVKDMQFRLFHWPKTLMPEPYWSETRRRFYIEQYGGEDSPEYKHNVLGEDGDPENPVFPWHQFRHCIKEIPEYRCLKILVNSMHDEIVVTGYKTKQEMGDEGPVPRQELLMDTTFNATAFFKRDEEGETEFRRLIKGFFIAVPGLKRGGGDFGYSGDPTEIVIKNIIGKRKRMVARLQLKHVTYDQQCQAIDALDDVYNDTDTDTLTWGTDLGNAGSALVHDLHGLEQYEHKNYEERLKGYMFESTTENVNEEGEIIIDKKDERPMKITLKELATDVMTKKNQKLETEYPPDPDIVHYYTNHTVSYTGKHRMYKKKDDHLIDADRAETLAGLLGEAIEDMFSCGT